MDLFSAPELFESGRVKFYEYGHKYLLDGKRILIGVTSLMRKHGLAPDYSGIDPDVLAHAAELGTQAHRRIEAYIGGVAVPETKLIKSFRKLGLNICRTEYLVTDEDTVASSIDLLNDCGDGVYDIIDMKRTSTVHKSALAWQLGIYKYLFLLNNPWAKVKGCYCLPIKKGNKDDIEADTCGALVPIEPVSEAEVKALLAAEKAGTEYTTQTGEVAISEDDLEMVVSCSRRLEELSATVKMLEDSLKDAKERIYQMMLDKGADELDCGEVVFKLKRPYTARKFDSKAFKEAHGDLYDEFLRDSEIKGNITIKLK